MEEIQRMLEGLSLEHYLPLFEANDIDHDLLAELTNADLKEMGIGSLGHRKRILAAIRDLQQEVPGQEAPGQEVQNRASVPSASAAERREVVTVFADLTGYTRLSRELEAEDLHNILSVFYDRFDETVSRLGGTVERHIGDCVMAVFGAPISYGNDVDHALRAALLMHAVMVEISREFARELSVHVGVASGNVLFSSQGHGDRRHLDFSLTGDSVNLASRLADQAQGGETLITEPIYLTLAGRIDCDAADRLAVKGFETPVAVYRFKGFLEKAQGRRLIGRGNEMAQFRQCMDECVARSVGQVVALSAEAGLGKSSLVEEFLRVGAEQGFRTRKALVLDFGLAEAQDPFRDLLSGLCGVDEEEQTIATAIEDLQVDECLDEQSALFMTFLLGGDLGTQQAQILQGMSHEANLEGQFRAVSHLLTGLALEQPLLLVIEDIHWADDETVDQIAMLARAALKLPIVLVLTLRPESDPLTQGWIGKAGEPVMQRFHLAPLSAADARALALQLIDPPIEELIRECVARAEGNPLFLDQLLRHAHEQGMDAVPGSIQSIVQARLDRLSTADRRILETAAILGQRFDMTQIREVSGLSDCDESPLVAEELIRPVKEGYLFAHALIRDAVLRTILRNELRQLHQRAAVYFSAIDLGLRAEHLAAAQDPAAGSAFLTAARGALSRHRKETTLSLAERGLAVSEDRDMRIQLMALQGDMLRDLGRSAEAIDAFEAALNLAENPEDRCRAQIGIVAAMRIMDRIDEAYERLDTVQAEAEQADLTASLSEIHYFRGSLHFPRGNLEGCLQEHGRSLEYAEAVNHPERRALALSGLGDAHYARGRMFTAHGVIESCLQLCDEHHLVAVEAANRFMLATVKIYMNETERALVEARNSASLAAQVGHARAEIVSRLTTGWILASMGRWDEAEAEANQGLEIAKRLGARRFEPFLSEILARVAMARGDAALATRLAEDAVSDLRELDAMSFIGPWLLSTLARVTPDPVRRAEVLAEGEGLLAAGCVGHNYYRFYRNAMEACLDASELDEAERYADQLLAYTAEEPTPWSTFYIERTRALVDAARGNPVPATLENLRSAARAASLHASVPRIEAAIGDLAS